MPRITWQADWAPVSRCANTPKIVAMKGKEANTGVSFATKWLAPRLHRLKECHPEFDVHLDVTDLNVDLNDGQVDAAIRGEGIALGRSALVADDIAAGRLVAPFAQIRLKAERGYDLVYRPGNEQHAKVSALRA